MKVCVTSLGDNEDSMVDPRFGRCQYFIFVDLHARTSETLENPNVNATGGAGIQAAQFVASHNVDAVITGHIGPNAFKILNVAGISSFIGASGSVKEAVATYEAGQLTLASAPDAASKAGMQG